MPLTITLRGMHCDTTSDTFLEGPEDEMSCDVQGFFITGGARGFQRLRLVQLGDFNEGDDRVLNIQLFSGAPPSTPDSSTPSLLLSFNDADTLNENDFIGSVRVFINGSSVELRAGAQALDFGVVSSGIFAPRFSGTRDFFIEGNGGRYHVFLTAQLS